MGLSGPLIELAGINPHCHTGSLDRFGRFIGLAVPPIGHFLQLFFKRSELVRREFQIFQPFFVLLIGQ